MSFYNRILGLILLLNLIEIYTFPLSAQNRIEEIGPIIYNIVSPSPNVSSINKFGDIPVNTYTGKASINVPIHTVSSGDLKLEISLSYLTGGIKVDEIASNVGLGWALNSGGMISRTVRGLPDESINGYLNNQIDIDAVANETSEDIIWEYYNGINENRIDLQPDIYTFSFFEYSGKFFIDKDTKECILIDNKDNLSIVWHPSFAWTILDGKGNKYLFGALNGNSGMERTIVTQNGRVSALTFTAPSAWMLMSATDIKGNVISFSYEDYSSIYCHETSETKTILDYEEFPGKATGGFKSFSRSWSELEILGKRIRGINWAGGSIEFNYSSLPRKDLNSSDGYLQNIVVKNFYNEFISKFKFYCSYFDLTGMDPQTVCGVSSFGRLRLDKIQQVSSDESSTIPPYIFTYYNATPHLNSKAQDHWGFFNGSTATSLIPTYQYKNNLGTSFLLEGADRRPNLNATLYGSLSNIKYPTGGSTTFHYELNESFRANFEFETIVDVPHVEYSRVEKSPITSGLPYKKVYFSVDGPYNNATDSEGFYIEVKVVLDSPCDPSIRDGGCGGNLYINSTTPGGSSWVFANNGAVSKSVTYIIFLKDGNYELGLEAEHSLESLNILKCIVRGPDPTALDAEGKYNKPIGGLRIKETIDNDGAGNTIINKYSYTQQENNLKASGVLVSEPIYHYWTSVSGPTQDGTQNISHLFNRTSFSQLPIGATHGSHIGYSFVAISKRNELFNELGRSTFKYTTASDFPDIGFVNYPFPPQNSNDCQRGLLTEKTFETFENNQWSVVNRVQNFYTNPDSRINKNTKGCIIGNFHLNPESPIMIVKKFTQGSKWIWLKKSITEHYDNNGTLKLTTSKEYFFDNPMHKQISKISVGSSKGIINTYYKYPPDFQNSELDAAGLVMKNDAHIWNFPLQTITTRHVNGNEQVVDSEIRIYNQLNNFILPTEHIQWNSKRAALFNESSFPTYFPIEGYLSLNDFYLQASYEYNENGNLINQKSAYGVNEGFLWGYNNTYPIAHVKNARAQETAFSGFENGTSTDWTIDVSKITSDSWFTGSGSYNISNSTISKSNLISSKKYRIRYWKNSSIPCSILGSLTEGKKIREGKQWTLFEHIISGVTNVSIIGDGFIDELLLVPENAIIETYTYSPLIGPISRTDMDGSQSYFFYDKFSRLFMIKNERGEILRKVCYNYFGQSGECDLVGTADWQLTNQTRCEPCEIDPAYNTGFLQYQQIDQNPSSITYGQLRWIGGEMSPNCIEITDWQLTGNKECEIVDGKFTGYLLIEEIDRNPCSSLFNSNRWVRDELNCSECPLPANWQPLSEFTCEVNSQGINTGYKTRTEKDLESCSVTFNQTRIRKVYDPTTCPIPYTCTTTNCLGEDKKCINNICETGCKVYTSSVYTKINNPAGDPPQIWVWRCTYHYQWSDGTISPNYTEDNTNSCTIGNPCITEM